MAEFRFLHISDLHLTTCPFSGAWDISSLIKIGKYINKHSNSLDLIVLSGDLSENADQSNLKAARELLLGDSPNAARLSSSVHISALKNHPIVRKEIPVCVLPGNHDRFFGLGNSKSGSKEFESVFGDNWEFGNPNQFAVTHSLSGCEFVKTYTHPKESEFLTFCLADFSLAKSTDTLPVIGSLGNGKVYANRLNALIAETRRIKDDPALKNSALIWVIHFSPHTSVPNVLKLLNSREFSQSVADYDIPIVLAGHTHQPLFANADQRTRQNEKFRNLLLVAGSATAGKQYATHKPSNPFVGPFSFNDVRVFTNSGKMQQLDCFKFERPRKQRSATTTEFALKKKWSHSFP